MPRSIKKNITAIHEIFVDPNDDSLCSIECPYYSPVYKQDKPVWCNLFELFLKDNTRCGQCRAGEIPAQEKAS